MYGSTRHTETIKMAKYSFFEAGIQYKAVHDAPFKKSDFFSITHTSEREFSASWKTYL